MNREPQITFKNIARSEALENIIRERIGRLEKFHHHIVGVRVVIEEPHVASERGKSTLAISVEVDVAGRPKVVVKRSDAQHEAKGDRYAFATAAFDAVQRQLEDMAAKQNREVKRHNNGAAVPESEAGS
jgi:ribosomal subunit interface protein